jgi:hypothetical protein
MGAREGSSFMCFDPSRNDGHTCSAEVEQLIILKFQDEYQGINWVTGQDRDANQDGSALGI